MFASFFDCLESLKDFFSTQPDRQIRMLQALKVRKFVNYYNSKLLRK